MSAEAWTTLVVLGGALALLVTGRGAPALVVLGANVVLLLLGVIDSEAALAGFSNPAPFTVAALYVVARAVEKTGALQPLLLGPLGTGEGPRGALARLLWPVAALSGFLNNTPVVAMVSPQVSSWARRYGRPASLYLMPLSFATILGGLLTVIGTSTTVVVSGLMEAAGMRPIGMFEIGRVGVFLVVGGLAYLVLAAPRLLPDRRPPSSEFESRVRDFVVQMVVVPGGALDGATVETGGLRQLQGVFLVEVRRGSELIAPATPETELQGGDRLLFAGRADTVLDLQANRGLVSAELDHAIAFHEAGHQYFEAVVGDASPLAGKTLREADFRQQYQAAVVAIHRAGSPVRAKLGTVRLRAGDTLLLLADSGFKTRWAHYTDFLLVSHFGRLAPGNARHAWAVGLVLAGIVGSAATGWLPVLHAALAGALLCVVLRVLTPVEAWRGVAMDVVVLVAASFGLGAALEASGLAQAAAGVIFGVFGPLGPRGVLLGIALTTLLLTELITNNAAAVLVFPIAMAAALEHGIDPRPLAMGLAVVASASFLTPLGYQTNTMVYGAGGYRFTDFARLGAPLTVLVVAVVVVAVPLVWPF
jgi:di/tricarboxylate transporter